MGSWGPSLFSDDMALDIRREYSVLLSVGKNSEEAEKMLINYYSNILNSNDPDADVFWYVLALCEWKKGRLSSTVREKALSALEKGRDLDRWNTAGNEKNYEKRKKVLEELKEIILSPQPPVKKVKKPTVHHCPWKAGSLLAYRIIANKEDLFNHPCYMKYVLLRVVKIAKHPVSKLFDTGYYDESMLVGLYNWIGGEIPDSKIVSTLNYIPVERYDPPKQPYALDNHLNGTLSEKTTKTVKDALDFLIFKRTEKCVWLDWLSSKTERGDITFLGCDNDFSNNIPEFFGTNPSSRTYTHFIPFDISLAKIFDPYLENQRNTHSVII